MNTISDANTWSNQNLIQLYVNAQYTALLHGYQNELLPAADDEAFNIHQYGNLYMVQTGQLTQDNVTNFSTKINYWSFAYGYIYSINVFFSRIDAAPVDAAFKAGAIAEMRFLRAYIYANLIWRYGSVPIITKVFDLHDNFQVTPSSYDDCVKFIDSELDSAAAQLPPDQPASQEGRASANACLALKARVLLYDASLLNNPNHDITKWQAAADASAALLNLGYSLNPDYQGTFLAENNEIIFARHFTQANSSNFSLEEGRNGSNGWTSQNPSQNQVNAYEMAATGMLPYLEQPDGSLVLNPGSGYDPNHPYDGRDPRLDASLLHDGSVWQGRVTETFDGGLDSPGSSIQPWNASLTSYAYKKGVVEAIPPSGSTVKPTNPWIFFRYAEVLLNYAEAEFELGNEPVARQYINMVRARPSVNMPPVTEAGDALRARIQNERRVELAFEELRFFDVRRWKTAAVTENIPILRMHITKQADGSKVYQIQTLEARSFLPQHYLMPIPRSEVDKSQGSLTQNPGY
ncbi:RagB/SusD family nutrient uptake outer membrane protein [Flavitalea sp. BT771]|uniref:RagB/SusD family nutrient uptake outer membrane protein n=1 Tax=Flavitalea sp. BT771 TaxID=3063329 RepID=UPI0026E426DD|nr:RagB/SusD family nutrient uptake outer membrane protein [Flavitalea sp. BT771]MDO6430047.1 RagB/SusD family nutrient uptake outer membrane protein [Flavitalea sp. BT771]MDV6219814.1 RagB/SusD family nutrient uptake outer membrane protein [Flavitalea sp. BT771]